QGSHPRLDPSIAPVTWPPIACADAVAGRSCRDLVIGSGGHRPAVRHMPRQIAASTEGKG
ncbi:MAG: hypothetical protein ABI910_22655, partial [Gemmatimonadota bacterium]